MQTKSPQPKSLLIRRLPRKKKSKTLAQPVSEPGPSTSTPTTNKSPTKKGGKIEKERERGSEKSHTTTVTSTDATPKIGKKVKTPREEKDQKKDSKGSSNVNQVPAQIDAPKPPPVDAARLAAVTAPQQAEGKAKFVSTSSFVNLIIQSADVPLMLRPH